MREIHLTTEQEFKIRAFQIQVDQMSLEQSRQILKELHRQMVVQEVLTQKLLAHQWGIPDHAG